MRSALFWDMTQRRMVVSQTNADLGGDLLAILWRDETFTMHQQKVMSVMNKGTL
jgi:hypothetical protein